MLFSLRPPRIGRQFLSDQGPILTLWELAPPQVLLIRAPKLPILDIQSGINFASIIIQFEHLERDFKQAAGNKSFRAISGRAVLGH